MARLKARPLLEALFDSAGAPPPASVSSFLAAAPTLGEYLGELDGGLGLDGPGPVGGMLPLLRRIRDRTGLEVETDQLAVTAGAGEAVSLVTRLVAGPGDEVIVECPGFPLPRVDAMTRGVRVRRLRLLAEDGWRFDLEELAARIGPKTKAIFLSNPNVPTGRLLDTGELEQIARLAASAGAYLVCNESYGGLEWGERRATGVANLYRRGISVGSVSRILGLQSLSVGWVASQDRALVRDLVALRGSAHPAPNVLALAIAHIALGASRYEAALASARKHGCSNLEVLDRFVTSIPGMSWHRPQGGLIGFARLKEGLDAARICERLLERPYRTFAVPGSAYGYPGYLCLGAGGAKTVLESGLERLGSLLRSLDPELIRQRSTEIETPVRGPAAQRIGALISAHLGLSFGVAVTPWDAVEICHTPKIGDFKVDLSTLVPEDGEGIEAACATIARRVEELDVIEKTVVIPPRLFLRTSPEFLEQVVTDEVLADPEKLGCSEVGRGRTAIVSFSSPNANKPLHIGHLRNNFLGMALSNFLEAKGYRVVRTAVLSDCGVHICQAAHAYQAWGRGETPESAGVKSDTFVGDQYVRFHRKNAHSREAQSREAHSREAHSREALGSERPGSQRSEPGETELDRAARALLLRVEAGDPEAVALVERIVDWATRGIERTHGRIGSRIDTLIRESETLGLAKDLVAGGVSRGVCHRRADGSVFIDLTEQGLGHITLLRTDATTLSYTQVIAAITRREERYRPDQVLMISGEEWKSGMTVICESLRLLGMSWTEKLEAVHYGMVDLPAGRMKSREGAIVEADDLIDRMQLALAPPASTAEDRRRSVAIGEGLAVGVLKLDLLRAKRSDRVAFDERRLMNGSRLDLARLVRLSALGGCSGEGERIEPASESARSRRAARRKVLIALDRFGQTVDEALARRDPGHLLRYLLGLAGHASALGMDRPGHRVGALEAAVGALVRRGLALLNIELPERPDRLPLPFASGVGARH